MTKSTQNGSGQLPKTKKTIHYHAGFDHFTPEVGSRKEMVCLACGSKMKKEVCSYGPTGMAEAMSKSKHFHDTFSCKYSGEKWHDQVIHLFQYMRKCPSKVISDLIQQEIEEVIKSKTPTKIDYSVW